MRVSGVTCAALSDQEDEDEDSQEESVVASGKQCGRSSQGAGKKVSHRE